MKEAIICDGILHVNMFPYFLSHVVSTIFASDLPEIGLTRAFVREQLGFHMHFNLLLKWFR